jgi:hypothetical protein
MGGSKIDVRVFFFDPISISEGRKPKQKAED